MGVLKCPDCGTDNSEFNIKCHACGVELTIHDGCFSPNGRKAYGPPEPAHSFTDQTNAGVETPGVETPGVEAPGMEMPGEPSPGVATPGEPSPGDILGHFRIEARAGSGGRGTVFKAWDEQLERYVALKLIRGARPGDEFQHEQLLHEARLASIVTHPNIITIHGLFEDQGRTFIAMEWASGRHLGQLIEAQGLASERFLAVALPMAEGLAAAHRASLVHCDLKPGNIMLTETGEVKLLDFGLARLWASLETPGPRSALEGTLAYMSPEHCRGLPLDTPSDVFAFGSVLYFVLSGRQPFQGRNAKDLMSQITRACPQPLNRLRSDLPQDLIQLVHHCLRSDPAERPTMEQVVRQLKNIQRGLLTAVPGQGFPRLHQLVKLAFPTLAILLLLVWMVIYRQGGKTGEVDSLAVLPFENISGDPLLQVICDGLATAVSTRLARLEPRRPGLWIVPAGELRRLGEVQAPDLYRQFGVRHSVSGSLQHLGDTYRLTLKLVENERLRLIRSEVLEIPKEHIFTAYGPAVDKVLQLLAWPVEEGLRKDLVSVGEGVTGAHARYLEGLGYGYHHDQEGSLAKAIASFEAVLAEEPGHVPALIGLGNACMVRWQNESDRAALDRAEQAVQTALGLRSDLAEGHVALGNILIERGRFEDALQTFRQALLLEPRHGPAHYAMAITYDKMEDVTAAGDMFRKAVALAPNNWVGQTRLADFYYRRGDFTSAEEIFRRLIQLAPRNVLGYSNLAVILYTQGRIEEATTYLDQALAIQPSAWLYSTLGTIRFYQGRYRESVRAFEQATTLQPEQYLFWGNLADAYRWLPDQALAAASYHRAIALLQEQLEVRPEDREKQSVLALYNAKLGQLDAVRGLLQSLGEPTYLDAVYERALIHELLGERQRALDYLERALTMGYPPDEVVNEPEFRALRADPSGQALLARFPAAQIQASQPVSQ